MRRSLVIFILALSLLASFLGGFCFWLYIEAMKSEERIQRLESENIVLELKVNRLKEDVAKLDRKVTELKALNDKLQKENQELNNKLIEIKRLIQESNLSNAKPSPDEVVKVVEVTATAYGSSVRNGGAGTGKTATGVKPKEGLTVAVDTKRIPLGTKLYLECESYPEINGRYEAQDVGGAIKGGRIDIYMDDTKRAKMLDFGKRKVKVYILKS